MTTLLIQTEQIPLTVSFPALAQMTEQQFYEFCQANRELRIERTVTGDVIVMPPDSQTQVIEILRLAPSLRSGLNRAGLAKYLTPVQDLRFPMEPSDRPMPAGSS